MVVINRTDCGGWIGSLSVLRGGGEPILPGGRWATSDRGPSLDGLGSRAGTTVDGDDARTYVERSITNPDIYVVEGYQMTVMPNDTRERMTKEEFDTLVDWMLEL